jgi:HEAT repeat protein
MKGFLQHRQVLSLSSVLVLAFVLTSTFLTGQTDREEKVEGLYEKGVQQLEQGDIDKAYNSFQQSIEEANNLPPEVRGELLRWLWEQTSTQVFNQMLSDPKLRHSAERILELSKGAYWSWKIDDSRINELVNQLTAESYQTRLEAQRKLMAAGQYAAPRLIKELSSEDAESRTMAVTTLSDMGEKVVLPIIEALESSDETLRRNAALVLGNLKDPRSLPALKETYENDQSNLVKREARASILNILESRIPERIRENVAANNQYRLRNNLRARVDRLMVRVSRRKQNHTHNWNDIKQNYLKAGQKNGSESVDSSEHIVWEGASDIGLKNIYIDDAGLKYIVHTHDVDTDDFSKRQYTHRHYLTHLRGLPSQLKQHVFRKRASEKEEIVAEQLDRLLTKSAREGQQHRHSWDEVKGHLLGDGNGQGGQEASSAGVEQWPGAKALGLKNIYVDEVGMKYMTHTHQGEGENGLGKHRHYLKNIDGLPSRLKQYVDYWRALEVNLFDAQTFHNLASSEKLYHRLAESYFGAEPAVMRKLYGDSLVWSWNEERKQVEGRKVPDFAYNLELAAQAGLDGLDSNVRYRPNWPLTVSIYFSLYDQAETIIEHSDQMKRLEMVTDQSMERLTKDFQSRDLMLLPGQLVSQPSLYATLASAIRNDRPAVGVQSLGMISEFLETDDLPDVNTPAWKQEAAPAYPVVAALREGNLEMKYRAASLLVESRPLKKFYDWSQVVPSLVEAVRMTGMSKVVLSSSDQQQVNRLRRLLRDPNLQVDATIARTPSELLSSVKTPPVANLILVDGDLIGNVLYSFAVPGRSEDHQQRVIDALKDDVRSKGVPIIAIADDESEKTELLDTYGDRIDHIVTAPLTVKKLMDVMQSADGPRDQAKGMTFRKDPGRLSLMAAQALESIDVRDTIFTNYSGAVVELGEVLKNRPDALRVAAANALASIGDKRAIPPLLDTLDRQEDPSELRAAAGRALANIFQRLDFRPSDAVLRILVKNASDGPGAVQKAATKAFGAANVKPEKRFELLRTFKKKLSDQTAKAGN